MLSGKQQKSTVGKQECQRTNWWLLVASLYIFAFAPKTKRFLTPLPSRHGVACDKTATTG